MAEESGSDIAPLNEETSDSDGGLEVAVHEEASGSDGGLEVAVHEEASGSDGELGAVVPEGNEISRLYPETQIALTSSQNENQPTQCEVVIAGGTYHGAHIGPRSSMKVVEAYDYRNAKITHIHYHHGEAATSEESSTSGSQAQKRFRLESSEIEDGYIQISDDIFINSKKLLREGSQIFEGYQEHVCGIRLPIAVKRIVPCTDAHIKEVEHLVKLASHPNIVRIIQSKETDSHIRTLYIAMELCSSQNLQDYLDDIRTKTIPFDFKKAMSFTKQLIDGVRFIHSNGILHGDMKPENVLLSEDKQQIKITDFGLGKQLCHGRFVTKVTGQGTDGYRAPETYNSDVISKQADVFSLGLTVFGIWSYGKHPFGDDVDLLNYNIKKNKGRDLSGLMITGTKKDELIDLMDKMLEHDPRLRSTIEEVSQHPFLVDELNLTNLMQVASIKVKKLQTDQDVCDLGSDLGTTKPNSMQAVCIEVEKLQTNQDVCDLVATEPNSMQAACIQVKKLQTDQDVCDLGSDLGTTKPNLMQAACIEVKKLQTDQDVCDLATTKPNSMRAVCVEVKKLQTDQDVCDLVTTKSNSMRAASVEVKKPQTDQDVFDLVTTEPNSMRATCIEVKNLQTDQDVSDLVCDLATTNSKSFGIKSPHVESIGLQLMGESWRDALVSEFGKDYFATLCKFVATERASQTIYPPATDVFSWTVHCNIRDVKVVILGQNPYHGPNQAHGLSFSVKRPAPPPPSLKNMFKELANDIEGFQQPGHGDLTGWAKKGVLLLNTVLTVRAHSANSHKNRGWEKFTDAVIKLISSLNSGVVFLLWGLCAQKKGAFIDKKRHHVLQCAHPSPLSAYRGFLGCKHFSQANQLLKDQGDQEIDWCAL